MYGLLLHLYPASFRNEYGGEMRAVFERRRQATSAAGAIGLWLETIPEMIGNALLVHFELLRQDLSYTGRMVRRSPGFAITAAIIVAICALAGLALFDLLALRYGVDSRDRWRR